MCFPSLSEKTRPIVFMVYACPWFFDSANHVSRIPLDMPIEHYSKLAAPVRPLLSRAFSYAVRARWHEIDARGPAVQRNTNNPSSGGSIGRNDPCPCGSGKKSKHCHGRIA